MTKAERTETLVRAAQGGDSGAFETLVFEHTDMLWQEACRRSRQFDDARDLMQETLIRAFQHLHQLTYPYAVGAWLRTMMRRLAANRAAREAYHSDLLHRYAEDIVPASVPDPDTVFASQALRCSIEEALTRLTDSSRYAFTAYYLENRSIASIAESMGLSANAVKQRLFYARNTMKKELHMTTTTTTDTSFPDFLKVHTIGEYAHAEAPLHPVRLTQSLLVKRLLFVCRKSPKSIAELAGALGVEAIYLKDIIPDLVAGEVLQEEARGTYIAPFIYATEDEVEALNASVPALSEGVPIIREHLPGLKEALQETTMIKDQGYELMELLWSALTSWLPHSLYRHVDSLPTWGRHHINIRPPRPVDDWYLIGYTRPFWARYAVGATARGPENGMYRAHIEGWPCTHHRVWIYHEDQERYIGRLSRGPRSEADLVGDAPDPENERETLARYVEQELIVRMDDGLFRMNMPVINTEDDEKLIELIDDMAIPCMESFVDGAISSFAERVEELGFGHVLPQSSYVGFCGLGRVVDSLIAAFIQRGILVEPESLHPKYGFYAWYHTPRLTTAR